MYGSDEERERLARFAKLCRCLYFFRKRKGRRGGGRGGVVVYHDVPYRRLWRVRVRVTAPAVRGGLLLRTRRTRWMSAGITLCADAPAWLVMWVLSPRNKLGTAKGLGKMRRTPLAKGERLEPVLTVRQSHVPLARQSFDVASSATKERTSSMYVRASSV